MYWQYIKSDLKKENASKGVLLEFDLQIQCYRLIKFGGRQGRSMIYVILKGVL